MSDLRVLILGNRGQLGTQLQLAFAEVGHLAAYDRDEIDVTSPAHVRAVVEEARPDVILNATAYTAVDRAESEPEIAMAINGEAPGLLAREAATRGALLVHYSTDYVFDGTKASAWSEEDEPRPLNVYGRTKLAGERAVQQAGGRYFIFRTSWVYGPTGNNFLHTMLRLGRERRELSVVADQFGAPTSSLALAKATCQAVLRTVRNTAVQPVSGLFHMTCGGSTSWYEFARAIFAEFEVPESPEVIAISSQQYGALAARPRNSVLSNQKLESVFGIVLPHWQQALEQVANTLALQAAPTTQRSDKT